MADGIIGEEVIAEVKGLHESVDKLVFALTEGDEVTIKLISDTITPMEMIATFSTVGRIIAELLEQDVREIVFLAFAELFVEDAEEFEEIMNNIDITLEN